MDEEKSITIEELLSLNKELASHDFQSSEFTSFIRFCGSTKNLCTLQKITACNCDINHVSAYTAFCEKRGKGINGFIGYVVSLINLTKRKAGPAKADPAFSILEIPVKVVLRQGFVANEPDGNAL